MAHEPRHRRTFDMTASSPLTSQRALKWAVFLGATLAVLYGCLLIVGPFLNVIAWACVLAIAFNPMHRVLLRRTGRPSLSALLSSVIVIIAIVIPLLFVTGLAINQLLGLRDSLLQASATGTTMAAPAPVVRLYEAAIGRLGLDGATIAAWIREHTNDLLSLTAGYSLTIAANVAGVAMSFVFTMFAMFLLFRDGERMAARIPDYLPFERSRSEAMLDRIRDTIYGGVYGVVVIAALQGVLCGAIFLLLGIPSAALWGVVTVITSILPLVGSAAVWGPGALYLLLAGEWPQAIVLLAFGTLVISGVDNFLRPKLVGGRVGLSEIVMFFALLGGIQLFGLLGIVLGPVLFAIAGSILNVLSTSDVTAPSITAADEPSA